MLVNSERYDWPDKHTQSLEKSFFLSPFLTLRYILKQKIPKHEPVTEATLIHTKTSSVWPAHTVLFERQADSSYPARDGPNFWL